MGLERSAKAGSSRPNRGGSFLVDNTDDHGGGHRECRLKVTAKIIAKAKRADVS
jgi:hypothetical protein